MNLPVQISKSPDGNYICGGYVANNYLMIKFNLNGQFIDTFGNNGIFQNFSNIQDFYLQNSNIFLGGVQFENDEPIFKIICLNENYLFYYKIILSPLICF